MAEALSLVPDAVDSGVPPQPASMRETGLTPDVIDSLILKTLSTGEASGTHLADALRLPYGLIEPAIEHARAERLIEVRGAGGTGTAGYRYALTDSGQERARRYYDACAYIGPAPVPVPLDQYLDYTRRQAETRIHVDRERVLSGLRPLVLNPQIVDQLGPAISARRALFLYGPPGNGKSVIGSAIGRVLGGDVWVPHALDVDGQVVTVLDPVTHELVADEGRRALVAPVATTDRRWVRVTRPVITVGGELTLEMLDLTYNPVAHFYEAPVQLKANGGVLIVDDFGRQRVSARDLLNRWIIPLEARVDYLRLHTGRAFEVPFNVLVVFATNLSPDKLADEAFLRRIPYKVLAKNPTLDEFRAIFAQTCDDNGLTYHPSQVDHLRRAHYLPRGLEMRGCHPRDLITQVVNFCRYERRPPEVTNELLDLACDSYFINNTDRPAGDTVS
jgi:DNA-binding PadR family transcriptional regulator